MSYAKPPLPIEGQVQRLLERGLAGDRDELARHLAVVSYTRLEAYWHPFQNPDRSFTPGTTFDRVWQRYVFDRRLRLLVLDAIERIEVAVRTQLALHHSLAHDAFAYAEQPSTLPRMKAWQHRRFREALDDQIQRADEIAIQRFLADHGRDHAYLPVWLAIEVMSFGSILTFYRGAETAIRRTVADRFGVHHSVFESWLLALNVVRNFCAHHSRLWNRVLGVKPKIPNRRHDSRWHVPVPIGNDRIFGILTIAAACLQRIAPQSDWPMRTRGVLEAFPGIPLEAMGIPQNWLDCPIWTASIDSDEKEERDA